MTSIRTLFIVYNQGVEYWVDCSPPLEKFDTFPEVVQILVGVFWVPKEITCALY